jgi:hypothetical protein
MIKLEKGIPLPQKRMGGTKYPFDKMPIGYSFFTEEDRRIILSSAHNYKRKHGRRKTMEPIYPCTMQICRFVGEKAFAHHETTFPEGTPKSSMLEALSAVRAGLPSGFGASLTDARGYNVR